MVAANPKKKKKKLTNAADPLCNGDVVTSCCLAAPSHSFTARLCQCSGISFVLFRLSSVHVLIFFETLVRWNCFCILAVFLKHFR